MELAAQRLASNRYLALALACFVLVLDIYSKALVHQTLPLMNAYSAFPYGGIAVFPNLFGIEFSISHAINHGAAWGMFAHYETLLLIVRIVLVAVLIGYFFISNRHPAWRLPLALVLAGATGNILDSFVYGHVVDMFHFVFWGYEYPVFNIADSSIFVGIASLVIASWWE